MPKFVVTLHITRTIVTRQVTEEDAREAAWSLAARLPDREEVLSVDVEEFLVDETFDERIAELEEEHRTTGHAPGETWRACSLCRRVRTPTHLRSSSSR